VEMAQAANSLTTTIEAQLFCCNCAGAFWIFQESDKLQIAAQ
jgi:hypothetical protein